MKQNFRKKKDLVAFFVVVSHHQIVIDIKIVNIKTKRYAVSSSSRSAPSKGEFSIIIDPGASNCFTRSSSLECCDLIAISAVDA